MKRIIAIVLVAFAMLGLSACKNSQDEMISEALEKIMKNWEHQYEEMEKSFERSNEEKGNFDKHLEIKNTRVITIKENDIEHFEDIEYIIEFVLFTNYFNTSPYYYNIGMCDSVIVYKNGEMKVSDNVFRNYTAVSFDTDYSDVIESIDDLGDEYNYAINLNEVD